MCVFLYIRSSRVGLCCPMLLLLFIITCSSHLFLLHLSLFLSPSEMRLLSLSLWKNLSFFTFTKSTRHFLLGSFPTSTMSKNSTDKVQNASEEMSVLDLPDLVLECILEKLPAEGLCRMASVCRSLRERCGSDHLWRKHMSNKWGRIIGSSAFEEWDCCFASKQQKGLMGFLISLIRSGFSKKNRCSSPVDSIMSRYVALESGEFWFRAQVYNRENGHVGFMLSCYDAMVSYDRRTDSFKARYPSPQGSSAVESGVTWDRLRAPLVGTSPHHLHISDCLYDLHPGDEIEIQWRRNKEFPYGWWYGVVGHLERCDGSANYCRCHNSESVVLEFKQYARGSRWRRTTVSRREHREEGNEGDGFYGGIRKVTGEEEMSLWKKLWPAEALLE